MPKARIVSQVKQPNNVNCRTDGGPVKCEKKKRFSVDNKCHMQVKYSPVFATNPSSRCDKLQHHLLWLSRPQ